MSVIDELRFKEFPALDQGSVVLLDVMGSDHDIAQAARVSYGAGTKSVSDDRTLIRYLMRHRHTSPMEMAELKFAFRMPQLVWWQMVRHRMASANVESGRYSEMSDDMMATPPDGWRLQSATNRQGSGGMMAEWPQEYRDDDEYDLFDSAGSYLSGREEQLRVFAREVYDERLKFGVAREQARQDLPLSTYIRVVWKIDLHNLLHFLALRMDSHAQKEIRDFATIIGREIVAKLFPITWEAFCQYRMDAMTLTALDVEVIRSLLTNGKVPEWAVDSALSSAIDNKRERDECRAKLERLGLIS